MRSFLKYTLATITGIVLVSLVGFLILVGVISAIVSSTSKEVMIKDKSVLLLTLDASIVDRAPNDPFQNLEIPGFQGSKKIGLDDLLDAIEKAKYEDKIKGIYIRTENIMAGYATCEEIRRALIDFKQESGKFIYAYSENYSQKSYFIASVADKVFINPEGMLMFAGIASQREFYKNALDKLGIEIQVIRHGKFKAAVEPYMLEGMSPENKLQVETYIGSMWNNVLTGISGSRNITVEQLNHIADQNMMFRQAKEYLGYQLVDSLVYEDQMLDILRELTGTKPNKEINAHSVANMKSVVKKRKEKGLAKDKIAVIYAAGEITMGGASFGSESIQGPQLAKEIRKARTDSTIKAIVLRVNSPGGSALASELIWREVKLATEAKPVVVSMGELAASGGYYIACAADTIVANPSTITGSIGVFGMIPNTQVLFEKKLGINTEVVKTNELSDMPMFTRKMTTTERALLQNMVENVYTTFVNRVAEGRGLSYEHVDAIGEGRVWTGANALELGLVDVLGDLSDAIKIAEDMAGLDHYRLVKLPTLKDPIEELLSGFSTRVKFNILEKELGPAAKYYKTLEQIRGSNGIMARLPYEMNME
jgi:protease IV